jgi:biotin carboxyl carrier protein
MELVILQGGQERSMTIERVRGGYVIELDGRTYHVDHVHAGGRLHSLIIDGHQRELSVQPEGNGCYVIAGGDGDEKVEIRDPLSHLARAAVEDAGGGSRRVTAYMPGRVVALLVAEGEHVEAGQGVVVLEAMKMENEIQSEIAGVVARIYVEPGQSVEGGDALFEIGEE